MTDTRWYDANHNEITQPLTVEVETLRQQLAAAQMRIIQLTQDGKEKDEEIAAIKYAAHMPDDYAFGLPSWIYQRLYAAWIGAIFSPEVIQQIETGHLVFPDSPTSKENGRLKSELELANLRIDRAVAEISRLENELCAARNPQPTPRTCATGACAEVQVTG
jgi:hypothetical protein